jgi:hypothetical protein
MEVKSKLVVTVLNFSPYPRRRGLLGLGHVFENITPVPGT